MPCSKKLYFEASHRPGEAWKYQPTDANAATSRIHSQPTVQGFDISICGSQSSAR